MIKLISWNVNGIRAAVRKGLVDFLRNEDADVVCFQEIKANEEDVPHEITNLEEYEKYVFSAKKKGYSGTMILSKIKPESVRYGLEVDDFDSEGRVITLEFNEFFIVNAYFPNSQHGLKRMEFKLNFDHEIHSYLDKLRKFKSVIICGDFNVAHKEIDLANPKENEGNPGFTPQERAWMDDFLNDGYIDTFRMFTKEGGHYTWWSYRFKARQRNIGWRIDYFVVDEEFARNVKESVILSDVMGSDHAPIRMKVET